MMIFEYDTQTRGSKRKPNQTLSKLETFINQGTLSKQ
jgi:hypothetical protein